MAKNLVPGCQFFFFFLKNLAPSVTRYHGQLSSCTIEKINDSILRKLSDGRMDGWTDGQTDRQAGDFIGCCPTNVEHPKKIS